jgi:NAD(P) transhydrogenase subunit alpha
MELMPRITRAHVMDVLSSQANLAGYCAVIEAAESFGRAFPMMMMMMMMTAAGTMPAAKVFVMGVRVADLQAIATARRLGAVVTATDVRPAVKEQVESLGAKFFAAENEEFKQAETAGGYAKEMSKEYQAKQAALTAEHIKKQDIVITTALIPGRPAPRLISAEMLKSMKPRLGAGRSRSRAWRQCRRRQGRRGRRYRRHQDRRLRQPRGPRPGVGLKSPCAQPILLHRDAGR